jgi:hypothetical protein
MKAAEWKAIEQPPNQQQQSARSHSGGGGGGLETRLSQAMKPLVFGWHYYLIIRGCSVMMCSVLSDLEATEGLVVCWPEGV